MVLFTVLRHCTEQRKEKSEINRNNINSISINISTYFNVHNKVTKSCHI